MNEYSVKHTCLSLFAIIGLAITPSNFAKGSLIEDEQSHNFSTKRWNDIKPSRKSSTSTQMNDTDWARTIVLMNEEGLAQLKKEDYPIRHLVLLGNVRDHLHKLEWFSQLTSLNLKSANVISSPNVGSRENLDDIHLIAKFKSLTSLDLTGKFISDAKLEEISSLTNLKQLNLSYCPIFGSGIPNLSKLTKLEVLDLSHTAIDGKALEKLSNLISLRYLKVNGSNVTAKDIVTLQEIIAAKRSYFGLEEKKLNSDLSNS